MWCLRGCGSYQLIFYISHALTITLPSQSTTLSVCEVYCTVYMSCSARSFTITPPPPTANDHSPLSACVVIVRGVTQPTDSRTSYTVHQFAANSHSLTIALSLALPLLRPSRSPTVCLYPFYFN